jgi:hypothetical protein
MAALGTVPPATGAPTPPLPPPATPHTFNRVVVAGVDNELDYVSVRADASVIKGLPRLGWVASPRPNEKAAPLLSLAGYLCIPSFFEDEYALASRAMLNLGEVTMVPSLALLDRCADALDSLKMFSVPLSDTKDFEDKLIPALARAPSPSPFALLAGELLEANPFSVLGTPGVPGVPGVRAVPARGRGAARVPAVRGVAAIPAVPPVPGRAGPPDLEWWSLVKLGDSYDSSSVLPMLDLWRRSALAPDRTSIAARSNPTSRVTAISAILFNHLGWLAGDSAATHPRRARKLRLGGERLRALPEELRSGSFDLDILETEAADDFTYSLKPAQQDLVTISRFIYVKRAYGDLFDLVIRFPTGAARRDAIINLSSALPTALATGPLFARFEHLNSFVKSNAPLIIQSFNAGMPVGGPDGVIFTLLKQHDEWGKPIGSSTGTGVASGLDGAEGPAFGRPTDLAWRRALVEDPAFSQASERILALDIDTEAGRKSAIEEASSAECVAFQRYFANPSSMITRAPVFAILHRCGWPAVSAYIGEAQATNPRTGEVHELQKQWRPSKASLQQLYGGKFSAWDPLNGPDGAIALANLKASEPMLEVPVEQIYTVAAAIEIAIPFVKASMGAAGWSDTSSVGYTYTTHCSSGTSST